MKNSIYLIAAVLSAACSSLDQGADTIFTTGQYEGPADWTCLGQDTADPSPAPALGKVTLDLHVEDWATGAPVNGLTVFTCGSLDDDCNTPSAIQSLPNDRADNRLTVQLEPGFSGLLKFASTDGITMNAATGQPDYSNAYVPDAVYMGDTVYGSKEASYTIKLLRSPVVTQLATNMGLQLDPTAAIIVGIAFDCDDKPAADVVFEIDRPGSPYTLIGGRPQQPDPGEVFIPTDGLGQAGFANVPPGYVFLNGFVSGTKIRINPTAVSAAALPGQLTVVEIHSVR
jgi:hypothetical protein